MSDREDSGIPATPLRQQAEKKATADEAAVAVPQTPEALQRTLHELRVHQIQLEMQNEELRRAQADLEASRARYVDLYDSAPVGYLTLNEKGLIEEANLTVATMLGRVREALVAQPLTSFILPEDQDICYLHLKKLAETGEPQVCELRMVKKDEAACWVGWVTAVAPDGGGAPLRRIVIGGITERKRLEEEKAAIEAQNRQLQKAESLGRMAKAISHHFNNQLQAVIGQLEMALVKLPHNHNKDLAENLNAAMGSALKAAELSDMARTYVGSSPDHRTPLDLCNLCVLSLPMLKAAMPKNVALDAHLLTPGMEINADENQMRQVLTNLAANAWDAIGERQGTVRLTVKKVSSAEIPAANRFPIDWQPRDGNYVCLEVADTGDGIAPQNLEKLFDPFFSTKFIGRGMGLAVILGILRSHRGAATVESVEGRGSTFRVFLPMLAEVVQPQAVQEDQAPVTKGTGTLLLVEDEDVLRDMAASMLTHLGYTVLKAQDGLEALEVFRQHQAEIRVVLCDFSMPRLDGWGTLTALRKLAPAVPVILVSGYDQSDVLAGDHPEQPTVLLKKPYRLRSLREAIGRALE